MTEHLDVVIVGAGIAGISAAYHVRERCPSKSVAVLERRDSIGGTWDLFRYPGIRCDSDMYTLGFRFNPWRSPQAIAGGPEILAYLKDTAAKTGVDALVRFRHGVLAADWSDEDNRWTLRIDRDGEEITLTCGFLAACTGYYDYAKGYSPTFAGAEDFAGTIVHPQQWPEDLDYTGKDVVVIGSGATAVTLIPALADSGAKHVTMLQRSPTYIGILNATDSVAGKIANSRWLPPKLSAAIVWWKAYLFHFVQYKISRRFPTFMRKALMTIVKSQLPKGYDVEKHFGPRYNPWDERLCLAPGGDLFKTISRGDAEVVTDTIERFTPGGIALTSGREIPADIVVTATGLTLQLFGGAQISRNGEPIDLATTLAYKGMLLSGVPNMAFTIGYTNSSWTPKADLVSEFVCRLLNHMDDHGYDRVEAVRPASGIEERPLLDFTPGYILRAMDTLPKAGADVPWRLNSNYMLDQRLIRRGTVDDEFLEFGRHRTPVALEA